MRFGFRWRIRGAGRCREEYTRLLADRRPLLVVANHLTMLDSAVIGWGLGSALGHVARPRGLPWNVPLRSRVEKSGLWRALAYITKCVPVPRGGDRREVAEVLEKLADLLRAGEAVLMFPEGGRSRSGRVDPEATADGVGRLVKEVEGCRVLCVYLRGDAQRTWSNLPAKRDTFTIATRLVEPRTTLRGPRASRDIATQLVHHLVEMEAEHFAARAGA
jgi:1-acyl-sn-glycerol-3-phosphate acyltransferase